MCDNVIIPVIIGNLVSLAGEVFPDGVGISLVTVSQLMLVLSRDDA